MDDPIWDVTVFTKNRERLIEGAISQRLLEEVLFQARLYKKPRPTRLFPLTLGIR